ncbi:hypothetical protein [Paenibacillus turpanensis]|uniref:hypothetical protein n=1 Tax=Paenibacillus turpanensis TaxID=2689078 RepID=UPI00140AFF9A|nr:hypothetical protein [Paenibacillus turpanensis]
MKRNYRVWIFLVVLLLAGCSVTHSVSTAGTRELTQQLKKQYPVESIQITFMRPSVTCTIRLKDSASKQEVEGIISAVKAFVTVDSMESIAEKVDWDLEISTFYLNVYPAEGGEPMRYATNYFKTADASNHSEENLDRYQTWFEVGP